MAGRAHLPLSEYNILQGVLREGGATSPSMSAEGDFCPQASQTSDTDLLQPPMTGESALEGELHMTGTLLRADMVQECSPQTWGATVYPRHHE